MMKPVEFLPTDKIKIQIVDQGIDLDKFDDRELPTDVHIIEYSVGDITVHDVIRGYTMVDIFDAYYDKLRDIGKVHYIKNGFGRIKPKLYGKIQS